MNEAGKGKFPYKRGKYLIVIGRKDGFEVTFHTEKQEYNVTKKGIIILKGFTRDEVIGYLK